MHSQRCIHDLAADFIELERSYQSSQFGHSSNLDSLLQFFITI